MSKGSYRGTCFWVLWSLILVILNFGNRSVFCYFFGHKSWIVHQLGTQILNYIIKNIVSQKLNWDGHIIWYQFKEKSLKKSIAKITLVIINVYISQISQIYNVCVALKDKENYDIKKKIKLRIKELKNHNIKKKRK